MTVLTPAQALEVGARSVGGKADGLARLGSLATVPAWFVISGATSLSNIGRNGNLEPMVDLLASLDDTTTKEELRATSEALQELARAGYLDAELRRQLNRALEELGDGPFAVRSSMVGEDSAESSWAGQLQSFLYVSPDDVPAAIRGCWASAFTPHALAYRQHRENSGLLPRVAVVVQKMVTGQVSGVAFTADPTTGHRDHVRISAAWGLAEGVVSGVCNTDEFVVDHDGNEVSAVLADKDVEVVRDASGPGTAEVQVGDDRRYERTLTPEQIADLTAKFLEIADAFGGPQDIEWTLSDGELHILQARPVTALPAVQTEDGPRLVFDNSNIQESYCGVTTPLTFSFAQSAYASVYRQMMEALKVPPEVVAAHDDMLRNMLGLVRGRVYYNINNWYRGLQLLPSFKQNKEDMEAMMGLDVSVDFVEDTELSTAEKLKKLPRMLLILMSLLWKSSRLDKDVPKFIAEFEDAYDSVDRASFADASYSELNAKVEWMWANMIDNWTTPLINDNFVMRKVGALRRFVEESGVENPGDVVNNLMSGEEGIESLEPTRKLMRMARMAIEQPKVLATLKAGEPVEAFTALQADHPDYFAHIEGYIDRYGDRVIGELKLETVSAHEDPSFVIQVLRNFASRPDLDPDALAAHELKLREQAEAKMRAALSGGQWRKLQKLLKTARTGVKYRENMRLARTRLFGLMRDAYRAMGQRLVEAGKLRTARDVFYLTTEELRAYHEGRAVSAELQSIADARRGEYAGYEKMSLPHHFETRGPVYHGNRYEGPASQVDVDLDADVLHGTGCYPGTVEAPLRVVMSPSDNLDMTGHILTTMRTDPGWAPLFPAASGILVERGSTLSHSAVVARELGIPAVVGVPGLLQIVADGQRVVLDGAAGTVTRMARDS